MYQRIRRKRNCIFQRLYIKMLLLPELSDQSGGIWEKISTEELARIFLDLQEQGAENISLVTADQYLPSVVSALDLVKDRIRVPVVYNCSGYERLESLQLLSGYIDIFLPDLKYYDTGIAQKYSRAGDYFSMHPGPFRK